MISFEEFMKEDEEYIHMLLSFDIEEIAEAFRADEKFERKCLRNGHYSRGILAAALCEELNRVEREKKKTEDPTYEVFGDGETYYDVDYEELGEKIFLEKKNLGKCSFYDLKLDEEHYEEPFDGKNIFAEVLTDFFVIKVCFHVPYWFVTQ